MTKTSGVTLIIENSQGHILLMLRDNNPQIKYPNQWITLGGAMEKGETPEQAIIREMKEELELDLRDFIFWKYYDRPHHKEYVFFTKQDINIDKINLHEGQKIAYFSGEEILKMNLAYDDNELMRDYFDFRKQV